MSPRLEMAVTAFEDRFDRPASHAATAPGRVNLLGEHTDYNDGAVLPLAIGLRAVAVGAPAPGDVSTVVALDLDESATWPAAGPPPARVARWAATFAAVAEAFGRLGAPVPAVDVLLTGTIPIGAGLSSSAAMAVAYATLLETLTDHPLDPLEKARLCQQAEQVASGVPCGIMDMLASTHGRRGCALLIDCRSLAVTPVPLPPGRILVVDTRVKHDLAETAYAERRATCERAAAKLGYPALRDATPADLRNPKLSEVERRRASHVVAEHARTLEAARCLEAGDLAAMGDLLFAGHDSLRDQYEVSCPELDTVVESARRRRARVGDVHGARLTGAGFGGSVIVLHEAGAAEAVGEAIAADFRARHAREPGLLTVEADDGAAGSLLRNPL